MLIRVMYQNRTYDMVKDFFLENLIAKGRIERFCRADGWVEIGRDPVRGSKPPTRAYTGPERRDPVVHCSLDVRIRIGRRHYRPFFPGKFAPD